jgi:hypothetical protein
VPPDVSWTNFVYYRNRLSDMILGKRSRPTSR